MLRRASFAAALITIGLLCACGRSADSPRNEGSLPGDSKRHGPEPATERTAPRLDNAAEAQLNAALPAIGSLRGARALVDNVIKPEDRLFNSAGFTLEGPPGFELGRLDASDGGHFEWAIFGFAPAAGLLQEVQLTLVDSISIDPAYVGLINYDENRWNFNGPFSANATSLTVALPLDDAVHLSPTEPGTVYIVLIAPVGSNIALQGLTVRTLESEPPVADLQADALEGFAPLLVNFDASGSSDPDGSIALYEFDFEDDGTYDVAGTEVLTQHEYSSADSYTVRLRVTDDTGVSSVASIGLIVHGWRRNTADSLNSTGAYCSQALVNGKPAMSYFDFTDGNLRYVQATDADATGWGRPVTVQSDGEVGNFSSLLVVNGKPAIGYYDNAIFALRYVRAGDADGKSWGTAQTVDPLNGAGYLCSMAIVAGNPAIASHANSTGVLRYVRASDVNGGAWGAPVTVDSSMNTGFRCSLVVVNGRPAISYNYEAEHDLRYVRAADAVGSAWGLPQTIDSLGNTGSFTSMVVVNGRPAISYYDFTAKDLRYVRASDADGSAWGLPLTIDSAGDTGWYTSLALINGIPAISYYDNTNGDLRYVQASDLDGAEWGSPTTVDSANDTGKHTSLKQVNGRAGISYMDESTDDLRYANEL